jgi:hypothetical protein
MDRLNSVVHSFSSSDLISPLIAGSITGEEQFHALFDGCLKGSLSDSQKEAFSKAAAGRVRRLVKEARSRQLDPNETAWLASLVAIPDVRARTLNISNQIEMLIQSMQRSTDSELSPLVTYPSEADIDHCSDPRS